MRIKLKSNFIKKVLSRISKISDTPLLDFALIYQKFGKTNYSIPAILSKISGTKPEIDLELLSFFPFLISLLKRIKSYPIVYITKSKYFYESEFYIEKGVLIPRAESEILVDIGILYSIYFIIQNNSSNNNSSNNNSSSNHNNLLDNINEFDINLIEKLKTRSNYNYKNFFISYEALLDEKEKATSYFQMLTNERKSYPNQNNGNQISLCELCCGSSAIAISIIKELQKFDIKPTALFVDISKKAILIAKKNARNILGKSTDNIELLRKDVFSSFFDTKLKYSYNIIITNPPYLSKEDYSKLKDEVRKYEPKKALILNNNRNYIYARIADIVSKSLIRKGLLILEVSDTNHSVEVSEILENKGYSTIIIKDLQGIGRVVIGQKKNDFSNPKS